MGGIFCRKVSLKIEKVDVKELSAGISLLFLSLLMPLVFNMHTIPVRRHLLEALRLWKETELMTAALLLVALNALRGIPHYVGAFFIGESASFTWRGKKTGVLNAVLTIIILRVIYQIIYILHGVRYDFGIPAVLASCFGILFQLLNYQYISRTKKALLIIFFLTAFQFLDVMPLMNALPVGRGETSQDIKLAAEVLECEALINTTGTIGILMFFMFGLLIFFQLRSENDLRKLSILKEQNEAIRTQAQLNEMKNRTYQEMQYLVHDLKSPLTAVQALTGVLKMKCEAERRTQELKYLTHIETATEQMSRMISEILYEDQKSPISVEELFKSVLAQVSVSDYAEYVRVENDAQAAQVSVNHVLFPRVIVNLLQNSAQAAKNGQMPEILLHAESGTGIVRFIVTDNGVGIDAQRQKNIWNRGVSLHSSSGIGLAFVRSNVERMGGEIRMESELGKGTSVTITLPQEEKK